VKNGARVFQPAKIVLKFAGWKIRAPLMRNFGSNEKTMAAVRIAFQRDIGTPDKFTVIASQREARQRSNPARSMRRQACATLGCFAGSQ